MTTADGDCYERGSDCYEFGDDDECGNDSIDTKTRADAFGSQELAAADAGARADAAEGQGEAG